MQGISDIIKRIAIIGCVAMGTVTAATADSFTRAWVSVERTGKISHALKNAWQRSPLYPELIAESTEKRLGSISAQDLETLMAQYPDSAAIANLRWKKLFRLGRANWHKDFLFLYRPTDSVELNCYKLEARYRLKQAKDADHREAVRLWTHGKSQPKACDTLFSLIQQRGLITKEVRLRRIDHALEKRQLQLARWLAKPLDQSATKHINAWAQARRQPAAFLTKQAAQFPEWVDMAASRLASRNPERLLELIKNREIPDAFREQAILGAARTMAINLDPAAAPLLRMDLPSHPILNHWRVRYFIHFQEWADVLTAISQLAQEERNEIEWNYWASRALAMTGNSDLAFEGFRKVAESNSWYGFLAADYLGIAYNLAPKTKRPPETLIAKVNERADVTVARLLVEEGLTVMARRQWDFVTGRLDEEEQKAAAVLANRWNWHSRSAVTAHQSGLTDDYELRYPLAFEKPLKNAAKRHDISLSWLSGLMRSESLFMHDIRSPAGALGLMQVMPRTGRQTAKELNLRWRGNNTLINPSTNIRIGSYYLAKQLERFGHPALATAAYNAGPHRVKQWMPDESMPLDAWVASIPFTETRNYVQRVLSAQVIYEWRYNGAITRLESVAASQITKKE
ncbi:transglycosylase SLT domain-containing protein [Litorivicinus sp.]|nr:transglycosylase SLT domain-containing protein [Litorivicinus sp.]